MLHRFLRECLRRSTRIALAAAVDIVLSPILEATLEQAQLRRGERVVDIGCGTGASSIALVERAGPSGQVLGVDVSAPMLARAAERLPPGAPVKFVRADATTHGSNRPLSISFFRALASCFSRSRPALLPICARR